MASKKKASKKLKQAKKNEPNASPFSESTWVPTTVTVYLQINRSSGTDSEGLSPA